MIITSLLPFVHFYNQWRQRRKIFEALQIIDDVHIQLGQNERTHINNTRSYIAIGASALVLILELFVLEGKSTVEYVAYYIVYYIGLFFELSVAIEFNILTKAILALRGRMITKFQNVDSNHDALVPWCVKMENRLLHANVLIYKAYELVTLLFIGHYFFVVFFLVYLLSDDWTDTSYSSPMLGRFCSLCYFFIVQGPPWLVAGPSEKHLTQVSNLAMRWRNENLFRSVIPA